VTDEEKWTAEDLVARARLLGRLRADLKGAKAVLFAAIGKERVERVARRQAQAAVDLLANQVEDLVRALVAGAEERLPIEDYRNGTPEAPPVPAYDYQTCPVCHEPCVWEGIAYWCASCQAGTLPPPEEEPEEETAPPESAPAVREVTWRDARLKLILDPAVLWRVLEKRGHVTLGTLADAGGPLVVLAKGLGSPTAQRIEDALAAWWSRHVGGPLPWAASEAPFDPDPPHPWGDDCAFEIDWEGHEIAVTWNPRLGGTHGGLLIYRGSVIDGQTPEQVGVWRLEIDQYAQTGGLLEMAAKYFAEEMALRAREWDEPPPKPKGRRKGKEKGEPPPEFAHTETASSGRTGGEAWKREVRDPAEASPEPRVEIKVKGASASYRLAPLPDGRWAIQFDLAYQVGDVHGHGSPWHAHADRQACLDAFLAAARQHFRGKKEGTQAKAQASMARKIEDLAEQLKPAAEPAMPAITRDTFLIDLLTGKDVSAVGQALEDGDIPTVGRLLDLANSVECRRIYGARAEPRVYYVLKNTNGVALAHAHAITDALLAAGLLEELAPADPAAYVEPYAWEIEYRRSDGAPNQTCVYVGSEREARRKAMLRPHATEIVRCEGMTKEAHQRAYGTRRRP